MPDWPGVAAAAKQIGFLDVIGHSGIADANGVSQPDHGPAHKIDQFLQPAIFRSCAMGSAAHSWHNQGNGTNGDGGWAQAATEFDRQEMVTGYNATTLNGAVTANASSIIVTNAGAIAPLEYLVVGDLTTPGNCEIVQVASTYVGGTTVALQANTVNSHATGSPVYHAIKNEGRYLARSTLVVLDAGGNDPPYLGPGAPPSPLSGSWQLGTFGTTPGASRGLAPLMHALRFTVAQMRCSVIYKDSHPSCVYGANWNTFAMSGFVANNGFASNPVIFNFGGAASGTYHYTTVAGSTIVFTTPPDFAGGTVDVFTFSYKDGGGAIWDYSVSGATTVAMTSHSAGTLYDDRNVNAVTMNDGAALTTGKTTGSCFRITGLNAGVNVITVKATTLNTYGIFLGWGIEAEIPPIVWIAQQFRLGGYGPGQGYGLWNTLTGGYIRRAPQTTQTATVAAGAGTAAGSITLGTAVTVGTTATTNTAVYPGDTITLGAGTATEETRRIVGVDSTTTLHVDANFVNAHNSGAGNNGCIIGFQDADFVGGGYANTADTQGALSVPGLNGVIAAVEAEFDQYSTPINFDALVNPPGLGSSPPASGTNKNLANDWVHFSDTGAGVVADGMITKFAAAAVPTQKQLASYAVPNKRTFLPVYNESYPTGQASIGAGAYSFFANGWTNFYPMGDGNDLRTGFYKDSRTRWVVLQGVITNWSGIREDQLPSQAFVIPVGYRPRGRVLINAVSSMGPASMEASQDGWVYVTSGFWVLSAPPPTSGGAKLEFYAIWVPEA